ncbi:DNA cytosine methyltransferase [Oscillospiraceae bacterium OttesenSCG-928-F05]|nr:DNA cytosine methyltransferase [Oscillospiraceae bacterium OttesenSCG-928-F05]
MKVADFFCGAGGFSEGFRQAGFEICFAIDRWEFAVDTYKANKPGCTVLKDDIIRISELPDDEFHELIPDTEIILGSPPCVAFSNSNKSGKGDKKMGIRLLKAYLRIVARKRFKPGSRLRYWILENVPNIEKYMQKEYTADDLGLPGGFVLNAINETSGIYNAKYFGAPTNRKRFLCGEFPAPIPTHTDNTAVTLRAVLDSLGAPLSDNNIPIIDCNYPDLQMARPDVTDHHYIYMLQPFEWETAKRLKEDKGYMGRMSFPENLARPSRTVMANMSASSRESMILSAPDNGYRLPTVREVASMMSFPIDYRFYGMSKGTKHTLVGNAVPPKMSYALAKAIALDVGTSIPEHYMPIEHNQSINFYNLNSVVFKPKVESEKRDTAKFKYHIPYMIIRAYRVELTNYHSDFDNLRFQWDAEIHYSQGKNKAAVLVPHITEKDVPKELRVVVRHYIKNIRPKLLSYSNFQKAFCMTNEQRINNDLLGPYDLLASIKQFIETEVSKELWVAQAELSKVPKSIPMPILIGYYILQQITNMMGGID